MSLRSVAIVAGAAVVAALLAAALAGGWLWSENLDQVARIVSAQTGCSIENIEVEVVEVDWREEYRVTACGRTGIVVCEPQDPEGCVWIED